MIGTAGFLVREFSVVQRNTCMALSAGCEELISPTVRGSGEVGLPYVSTNGWKKLG